MSELEDICTRLLKASDALSVLLLDMEGRELAHAGMPTRIDVTLLLAILAGEEPAKTIVPTLLTDTEVC
jgi:hypothetical protein